jgi:GMP synthase (glutamine-hydrolysing)
MRKILVFQHVPYEPLGLLDPALRRAGFRIRYVNFGRTPETEADVARYHGLVVLGGPMNVDETLRHPHLLAEIAAIRNALALERPVLGICLGAQLLAAALGAPVHPSPVREIGWYPLERTHAAAHDPLLGHVADGQSVFQWHAYTFDLPHGAVHLASTESCRHQAFRYGSRAYGLQFHLEVEERLLRRWLATPGTRRELLASGGDARVREIEADTVRHLAAARATAERVFAAFIDLFSWRRQHHALGSR